MIEENYAPHERPTAITVVCILGFIGAALVLPALFLVAHKMPGWYVGYTGVASVVGLACLIGLWKMKRWAVIAYTTMFVLNQVVLIAAGMWNPMALIIPVVIVGITLSNYSKMT